MYLPQQAQEVVNKSWKQLDEMETSYSPINEWSYDRRKKRFEDEH